VQTVVHRVGGSEVSGGRDHDGVVQLVDVGVRVGDLGARAEGVLESVRKVLTPRRVRLDGHCGADPPELPMSARVTPAHSDAAASPDPFGGSRLRAL
jgi:hypothetical protein